MWIAIQHLYGIYTDFKKTINPIQYYDNGNDDYECDDSVVSARMADRPPVNLLVKFYIQLFIIFRHTTPVNVKTTSSTKFRWRHHGYQLIPKIYSVKVTLTTIFDFYT